jgi:hypothetical protein
MPGTDPLGAGAPLFADPEAPTLAAGGPLHPVTAAAEPEIPETPPPAGTDPAEAAAAPPSIRRRGQARRRLRTLQRLREVALRDLGGLVYEIHRSGTPQDRARHDGLVAEKARSLAALDVEIAMLAERLRVARGDTVLRLPGVGGACAVCGELSGSTASFCSACGARLRKAAPAVAGQPADRGQERAGERDRAASEATDRPPADGDSGPSGAAPSNSAAAPSDAAPSTAAAAPSDAVPSNGPAAAAPPDPEPSNGPAAAAPPDPAPSNGRADDASATPQLDDTQPRGARLP